MVAIVFAVSQRRSQRPLRPAVSDPDQAVPGDHAFVIRAGGLDRHYTVHVPPGYDGQRPMPVVVMLHGGGGTGRAADRETGWSAKADEVGFLAVFPGGYAAGPVQAQPLFGTNGQIWNDGSGRFHAGIKGIDDIGFLNLVLDELAAVPGGLSANLGDRLLQRHVDGVSSRRGTFLAGSRHRPGCRHVLEQRAQVEAAVALCYIAGGADPLNPLEGGDPRFAFGGNSIGGKKPPVRDSIQRWATALDCPTKPSKEVDQHGVKTVTYGPGRQDTEVVFVTVEGLGHTWAGGKSLLPNRWRENKPTSSRRPISSGIFSGSIRRRIQRLARTETRTR